MARTTDRRGRSLVFLSLLACHPGNGGGEGTYDTGLAPDPEWQKSSGPRYLGDEPEDLAGRQVSVGPADATGRCGVLVGTPFNAYEEGPVYSKSFPYHSGAFLLGPPYEGGFLIEVFEAALGGEEPGRRSNVGWAVSLPGDVTGDGLPDAAIDGDFTDGATTRVFAGPVLGVRLYDVADVLLRGDKVRAGPVAEIVNVDANQDGYTDLFLRGSQRTETAGSEWSGGVLLLLGPLDEHEVSIDKTYDAFYSGPDDDHPEPAFASSDIDGTGTPDLLAGAIDRGGGNGAAYLLLDPPLGDVAVADVGLIWEGEPDGGRAGMSVATEDLNGDGSGDVFIGAPLAEGGAGRAYVLLDLAGGALGDAPIQFEGRRELDWLGYGAAFGDFDGDGAADLAVGAPRNIYSAGELPGRVEIYRGPLTPGIYTEEDADRVVYTSLDPDSFGMLLRAGDLDLDGRGDLVVSAPFDPYVVYGAGSVSILFGAEI